MKARIFVNVGALAQLKSACNLLGKTHDFTADDSILSNHT